MAAVNTQVLFLFFWFFVNIRFLRTTEQNSVSCPLNDDASKLISFIDFVNSMVKEAEELSGAQRRIHSRGDQSCEPIDCADLIGGNRSSGVYTIKPKSRVVQGPVQVLCDMDDDGGGWTILQRRGDFNNAKDYFYRDWESYKTGFGVLKEEFWIGNDLLFALTNQRSCSIKFVLTDWENVTTYAKYDEFWIDDEYNNYTLHVDGYQGTAGDSFSYHNGLPFTTKDRKNDIHDQNCAVQYKGAWWYKYCHTSNLNGQYLKGKHESYADGVNWKDFREYEYSLKDTFMKIRPKNFNMY